MDAFFFGDVGFAGFTIEGIKQNGLTRFQAGESIFQIFGKWLGVIL